MVKFHSAIVYVGQVTAMKIVSAARAIAYFSSKN
jgi:hypothetical protein